MDKHYEALDFHYLSGAFRPLTSTDPFQFYRLFECELSPQKKTTLEVPKGSRLLLVGIMGHAAFINGSESVSLTSDSVLLCADGSYELVSKEPQGKSSFYCLIFEAPSAQMAYASSRFTAILDYFNSVDCVVLSENATEIRRFFLEIISELCIPEPTMLLVKDIFYQILITAYRQFVHRVGVQESDQVEMNAVGQTVYAIVRYIDDHLFSLNNLMDMAQELGYSYNYLSHLFRRKTGVTIQAYVIQKKIEQSTKLLADEQYSITEIATMLNYDCIQSFSKAFRRAMGVSPTEYRSGIKQ